MAGDEGFFSDAGAIGNDYSLDDADLSGALTARVRQLLVTYYYYHFSHSVRLPSNAVFYISRITSFSSYFLLLTCSSYLSLLTSYFLLLTCYLLLSGTFTARLRVPSLEHEFHSTILIYVCACVRVRVCACACACVHIHTPYPHPTPPETRNSKP